MSGAQKKVEWEKMGQKIAIVGGGQLGRMLAESNQINEMGLEIQVLDPASPRSAAAEFVQSQITGNLDDFEQIQKLGENNPSAITIEVEHTSPAALAQLEKKGFSVFPSSKTLKIIQNKWTQHEFLAANNFPVPDSFEIFGKKDLENLPAGKFMLKQKVGSYDGKGNFLLDDRAKIPKAIEHFGGREFLAQRFVDFETEISVLVARDTFGNLRSFEASENQHQNSILDRTIVPARIDAKLSEKAQTLARKICEKFGDTGIMGIELFATQNGEIWINEIAPRVHNSGHWTMDGSAETSQFAQHLRAVAGLELGQTQRKKTVIMQNIIGPPELDSGYFAPKIPEKIPKILEKVSVHLYQKSFRPGRKVGHINFIAARDAEVNEVLRAAESVWKNLKFYEIANPFAKK